MKLKHMLGITVLAVGTAIFGLAAPAMASGQYCTASNGNFSACTDVNGENSAINWASANATSSTAITEEVHVELVNPQGDELCNSNTVSINKAGVLLTCTWEAGGKDYLAGNYCTIVWRWEEEPIIIGGTKYEWVQVGPKNCLYVS